MHWGPGHLIQDILKFLNFLTFTETLFGATQGHTHSSWGLGLGRLRERHVSACHTALCAGGDNSADKWSPHHHIHPVLSLNPLEPPPLPATGFQKGPFPHSCMSCPISEGPLRTCAPCAMSPPWQLHGLSPTIHMEPLGKGPGGAPVSSFIEQQPDPPAGTGSERAGPDGLLNTCSSTGPGSVFRQMFTEPGSVLGTGAPSRHNPTS